MNHLEFFSQDELWFPALTFDVLHWLQLLHAASMFHGYWLMELSSAIAVLTQEQTWPIEILWISPAQAGLTHQQNRNLGSPGSWAGDASRAGVRRQVNHDLCLPLPDLGTRFLSQSSGLNLPYQINLMMYRELGRKLWIEAQYLCIKRQMGHKWYLLCHLCVRHILDLLN